MFRYQMTIAHAVAWLMIAISVTLCVAQDRSRSPRIRLRTRRATRSFPTRTRPHVIPEGPLSPEEQLTKFHLPPGFEIELVASEPEIYNPLSINFDNRGRMWVTDTIEYPLPPKGPGRDGLKVFEDTDGDGRYDDVTTLVDKLSMPTGAEPVPGGAIVFSVPEHLRLLRHQRRWADRPASCALHRVRKRRRARHEQRFHPLARRLDLRLPRICQHVGGEGQRRAADHDELGQRLSVSAWTVLTSSIRGTGR